MADALEKYRAKRDFTRTPEPAPAEAPAPDGRSYCIQKHAARRLHYDLRLEQDGVLLSWAVTRGPSLDPADKRLAVRTEDHPISYGDFEGTIPQGEYGGGTVMLWDRGQWEPLVDDVAEALAKGDLKFRLHGERLKGEWALIRIRPEGKRENWLLIKKRDTAAAEGADPTERWTVSVKTGRAMEAIAKGDKPARKTSRRKAAPPAFASPALCRLVGTPPDGDEWLHEIKYDGYRLQAAIGGGKVRLYTRSGKDWSDKFASLCEDLTALECDSALIDGEAAVMTEAGLSNFSALVGALGGGEGAITFFAFDLLHLDGQDLRPLPLLERKARLAALLAAMQGAVRFADHVEGHGARVFSQACRMGAEGIVSKRSRSPYRGGRLGDWVKVKCEHREEAVIVGWTPSDKPGREFASLLLATREGDSWVYRGRVGTGFDARSRAALLAAMRKIERKTPALDVPKSVGRTAVWVTPRLVAEIRYTERTPDGIFRHPSFLGLREDKPARDVSAEPEAGRRV